MTSDCSDNPHFLIGRITALLQMADERVITPETVISELRDIVKDFDAAVAEKRKGAA